MGLELGFCKLIFRVRFLGSRGLFGGSWVVISGVISPLIRVIIIVT